MVFGICLTLYKADQGELTTFLETLSKAIDLSDQIEVVLSISVNDDQYKLYRSFIFSAIDHNKRIDAVINSCEWNLGYGAGQNAAAMRFPDAVDYILICNYDIAFRSDFFVNLTVCVEKYSFPDLIAPIIYSNGVLFNNKKRAITWMWPIFRVGRLVVSWFDEMLYVPEDPLTSTVGLEYVSGCCFVVNRKLFIKNSGFDTRFFLHFEDAEFSKRFHKDHRTFLDSSLVINHCWRRDTYRDVRIFFITVRNFFRLIWRF